VLLSIYVVLLSIYDNGLDVDYNIGMGDSDRQYSQINLESLVKPNR